MYHFASVVGITRNLRLSLPLSNFPPGTTVMTLSYYNDVIQPPWSLKSPVNPLFVQQPVPTNIKNSPDHWPPKGNHLWPADPPYTEIINVEKRFYAIQASWCKLLVLCKNIKRHTAHTIVSLPNHRQWLMIHTSGLMMMIKSSTPILTIFTREINKPKTHNPIYRMKDSWEN